MTEHENQKQPEAAPQQDQTKQLIFFVIILALLVVWGVRNPSTALRIVGVLLGFGGIVMIHELGHFLMAKLGKIKVEVFSIGMGPVVLGIRKLKKGWRVRVLPKIGQVQQVNEGDNETEYQIALLPIGGYVKMLGQSDTGAANASDDPRSYANRPISVRIATVAAGVIFNAIGAVVIFMILFMNGIDLKPAVVGQVQHNSPAYDAGLKPGDKIVEVNGERFVDFESVLLAPALSEPGEPISFVIQHEDGTEEQLQVIAEKRAGDTTDLRYTGISPATTLTIEPLITKDTELLEEIYQLTGLYPYDEVKAVNGQAVQTPWEFAQKVAASFMPEVSLTVSRQWSPDGEDDIEDEPKSMVTVSLPVDVRPVVDNFRNEYDLAHFGSLLPRLKVRAIYEPPAVIGLPVRITNWFKTTILGQEKPPQPKRTAGLQEGDIILKLGGLDLPNYKQLRERVAEFKNKDMPVTVLRADDDGTEQIVELTVHPKADPATDRVLMGIVPVLDMENPVVAQVLSDSGQSIPPEIPAGATITAVDGQAVNSFYQVAQLLQANPGNKVAIEYRFEDHSGGTAIVVSRPEPVHAEAMISVGMPFQDLMQPFKADDPIEAVNMGLKKTWQFVSRSYVTLGRLLQGSVPVSALSGPVGIISMTYQVTGVSLDRYLYFLGLINACLAVMNLLPLPVLDGGHIVILLIEKVTGKPINERALAVVMYVGLALLLGFILWVTYFDLIRIIFGR